jgi:FlaA1/EpsC-like NDP-sugar epimerase
LVGGNVSLRDLQRVQIEDVLQRDRITPDPALTRALLAGKTVLVTGAGGSIGSELCLQIAAAGPRRLILVDKSENSLFYSHLTISEKYPDVETHPCLADITDESLMRVIFQRERPELIFHAAAFKHVGMMQLHPYEAIRNNVLGTRVIATLALEIGAQRFVNISTDKSVNPHCYMGLSKKFAEMTVKQIGAKHQSRFLNVRFGNVAGSTGSVLRLFNEQIKKGGPIRVTDPQATRYFMSIPEAVYLILCAASRGKNGETYIFDMGEPINIYQLARTLSLFSGYMPEEELPIEFIGLRDGEKVHEELWESWERPHVTENPLLFVLKGTDPEPIDIVGAVEMFEGFLKTKDHDGLIEYIDGLMPAFAAGQIPRLEIQDYGSEADLVEMPA